MADINDTKKELTDRTKYVPMREYDHLRRCYLKLEQEKNRFGPGAIILAVWGSTAGLWGSTALFLSECDRNGDSDYVSVDAGNVTDTGSNDSEEHGCYGPKTIGELKEKISDLEKKVKNCQQENKDLQKLSKQPKKNPEKIKPAWCPPVNECPYLKQY